jgi:hypothetical protein
VASEIRAGFDYGRLRRALREELRDKAASPAKITSPSPNKPYYTDWVPLSDYGSTGFLVYTPDGDPLAIQVEFSDGEYSGDLIGFTLSSTDYQVGKWNSILLPEFACAGGSVRLRITTGPTPPSAIKVNVFRRRL